MCRILDILYSTRRKLYNDRSLLIGFFFGICMSQLYTIRHSIMPGILVNTINDKSFDARLLQFNVTNVNRTVADKLYNDVKVLCWIMTCPENHYKKTQHVLKTWGKRCNKLLILSSTVNRELGTIALPVHEGRRNLWNKSKEAFKYIYNNYLNEYDWFLKADDDTYVIMENLRYLLYSYNPNDALYFGCHFKSKAPLYRNFMSGGAGYVLSKESVKRFVKYGLKFPQYCNSTISGSEDVRMGECMKSLGVVFGNSTDSNKNGRFFAMDPTSHVAPYRYHNKWYIDFTKWNSGLYCCSEYAITFHFVTGRQMYALDYLIYNLKPFGIHRIEQLPEKINVISDTTKFTQFL